jgi:hypothetical protein
MACDWFPGQQFALTEASYLLVRMLRESNRVEAVDLEELQRIKRVLVYLILRWEGGSRMYR